MEELSGAMTFLDLHWIDCQFMQCNFSQYITFLLSLSSSSSTKSVVWNIPAIDLTWQYKIWGVFSITNVLQNSCIKHVFSNSVFHLQLQMNCLEYSCVSFCQHDVVDLLLTWEVPHYFCKCMGDHKCQSVGTQ
jgi:hypothetical protein